MKVLVISAMSCLTVLASVWILTTQRPTARYQVVQAGERLKNVKLEDLGRTKRVTIDKENATIVEGEGKQTDIQCHVGQIRRQIKETPFDKLRAG